MAASIRFRVIQVFLDDLSQDKLIEPFWVRIEVEKHPYIYDVQSRIISMCREILHSKVENYFSRLSGPFIDEILHFSDQLKLHTVKGKRINPVCSLWLDGSLLPPVESTDIMRDNDTIVLKLMSMSKKISIDEQTKDITQANKDLVQHRHEDSLVTEYVDKNCFQAGDMKCENENTRSKDEDHLTSTLSKHSLPTKKKKSKPKDVKGDDNSLLDDSSHNIISNPREKKKRKKDKESHSKKKRRKKIDSSDESMDQSLHNVSDVIQAEYIDNDSNCESLKIEEMKKKLLTDLNRLAETSGLVCDKTHSADDMNDSLTALPDISLDNFTEVKKRRRRRKRKSKQLEKVSEPTRIEDKPRISHLNLPWDKQPQNRKITFESDEDEAMNESVSDERIESNGNYGGVSILTKTNSQHDVNAVHENHFSNGEELKNRQDMNHASSKLQNKTTNDDDVENLESNSAKGEESPKRRVPSRRFMLRSTGGILSSLRNDGDATPNECNSTPVTVIPTTTLSKPFKEETHIVHTVSPIAKLTENVISKSPTKYNSTPNMHSDSDVKFNELLQRRKLSNASCTVSTSQNGVTICSRKRNNRKMSGHSNDFANPATDVLMNKSTVIKFEDNLNELHVGKEANSFFASETESRKVEVTPLDVGSCPPLQECPCVGDIIGYKVLEMNEDYNPVISEFKTGKVCSFKNGVVSLWIFGNSAPKKQPGKFDLVYEEEPLEKENEENVIVELALACMMDARLIQRKSL